MKKTVTKKSIKTSSQISLRTSPKYTSKSASKSSAPAAKSNKKPASRTWFWYIILVVTIVGLSVLYAICQKTADITQSSLLSEEAISTQLQDAINNLATASPGTTSPNITNSATTGSGFSPDGEFSHSPELLTANPWVWESTLLNNDTKVLPARPGAFVLTFTPDGSLFIKTDCNNGRATYTINSEGSFKVSPIASTMMFCMDSQENVFNGHLTEVNNFFIQNKKLYLMLPIDSGTMTFTAGTASAADTPISDVEFL